ISKSDFGFRISDLIRTSDFGIWIKIKRKIKIKKRAGYDARNTYLLLWRRALRAMRATGGTDEMRPWKRASQKNWPKPGSESSLPERSRRCYGGGGMLERCCGLK